MKMKSVRIELNKVFPGVASTSEESLRAIGEALTAVNGNAKAFTVHRPTDVVDIIDEAELQMKIHDIPTSQRGGVTLKYRPAGPAAKSYGYSADSTLLTLTRQHGSKAVWNLTKVEPVKVHPRQPRVFDLGISDVAMTNVIKRNLKEFGRHKLPQSAIDSLNA